MQIDGVDPLVINEVLSQTARSQVQSSKGIKITGERNERGEQQQSQEHLERSVEQLNHTAEAFNIELRFKLGEENNEIYVYVVNTTEGKIIRRIPPETLLEAASRMQQMVGLILDALI
ncbi:MAG: flagellar protein FlaG [Clostridia bacterium]|nr:flagellar protein FlaG [Clostridia bacterium]